MVELNLNHIYKNIQVHRIILLKTLTWILKTKNLLFLLDHQVVGNQQHFV